MGVLAVMILFYSLSQSLAVTNGKPMNILDLKVLPLDRWQDGTYDFIDLEAELQNYQQIESVVGRPGRYLQRLPRTKRQQTRARVWFELPDGRAFTYRHSNAAECFLLELETEAASRLMPEDISALAAVYNSRYATRYQRRLYSTYLHAKSLREIGLSTRKTIRERLKHDD